MLPNLTNLLRFSNDLCVTRVGRLSSFLGQRLGTRKSFPCSCEDPQPLSEPVQGLLHMKKHSCTEQILLGLAFLRLRMLFVMARVNRRFLEITELGRVALVTYLPAFTTHTRYMMKTIFADREGRVC
jgi:hypothetical protein